MLLICDRGHRPGDAELAQQSSGLLVQRSSHRHRRHPLHLVRISARLRASVAGDPGPGSVDRSLGLHRNRSGADVRRSRKDRRGETSNVKRGETVAYNAPAVLRNVCVGTSVAHVTPQPQRGDAKE